MTRHANDQSPSANDTDPAEDGPAVTVGDVMNDAVVSAYSGALFKDIARALARNDVDTVPVVDEDQRVIGVITASDLLARLTHPRLMPRGPRLSSYLDTHRKRHGGCAQDLMTHPAITTTPETTITDAARLAARFRVRALPVVDGDRVLVGLITRNDLVKLFLRDDEDIRLAVEREVVPQSTARGRDSVKVRVDEGVVIMSGRVRSPHAVQDLLHSVTRVPGVVDVHSRLKVDGTTTRPTSGPTSGPASR